MIRIKSYKEAKGNRNSNFDLNDFNNHLSQTILTMIDDEVAVLNKTFEDSKLSLANSKSKLSEIKSKVDVYQKDFAKEKALSRVLSLISTLKQEGKLIGNNRFKVIKMLENVEKYDFHKLRDIEEQLSILLPDRLR